MSFKFTNPDLLPDNAGTRVATVYLFRAFRIIGLIPTKKFPRLYACYSVCNLLLCWIGLPLLFLMGCIELMRKCTPGELVKKVQFDINVYGFAVKLLILYLHRDKLTRANLLMDKFDAHCTTAAERTKIRWLAATGNRIYTAYIFAYNGFVVSSTADGLVNSRVPFHIYNPFIDWRASRLNLYLGTVVECFLTTIAVFCNHFLDVIPIIYVLILRTHITMLTERISNASSDQKQLTAEQRRESLISYIQLHRDMLSYCDEIRPVISLTTFVQFMICGSILGVTIINLMFFADLSSYVSSGIYLLDVLLQTFPLCYLCNTLVDDCLDMATALFHSRWHNQNKTYRKILLYFLQKAQQPMTFTGLGIFQINLATNIAFAKFAFTVYTLAKEAKLDEVFKN